MIIREEKRVPFRIAIMLDNHTVEAELNDSLTALAILDTLPFESDFNVWGDEIYFSIPVDIGLENGKEIVELGELGYWPPGNAFCIFYGATPGSSEEEIRPASPINPVGRITSDPKVLVKLAARARKIRIEKV